METTDVLVVGAGPTGLATACELRRFGLTVRVVDSAPRASEHSKALVIHARTREVFEGMGVAAEFAAEAEPMLRVQLFHGRQRLGTLAIGELGPDVPAPVMCDQSTTERLLAARLAALGGAVERERTLVAFADEGERVRATLRARDGGEETVTACWLVGADGAHSAVRHGLGLTFDGAAYEDMFDQADVKIRWDRPPGEAYGLLRARGLLVMLPLPRGRHRIIVIGGEGHSPEPTLEMFQRLVDEFSPGAVLHDPEIVRFRLHRRMAPRMSVGRVFLAGDAAHIHSPAGGQGMNTGIQDAYGLAWRLALVARGAARPELLTTYHDERHPIAARILGLTDRLFQTALTQRPALLWFRRVMIRTVLRARALQRRVARLVSQTQLTYREADSVVDARAWPRHAPAAGDRAPADTLRIDGVERSLHAWLGRSPRLTLLLLHPRGEDPRLTALGAELGARWGAAIDVCAAVRGAGAADHLFARWGVRGPELALLRPDGHVAVRAPLARAAALRAWAERWLT